MTTLITISVLAVCSAQTNAPAPAADRELADPYVDGHFGFSIRPPKDWKLVGPQTPEGRGDTLLRMVQELPDSFYHEILLKHESVETEQSIDAMLTKRRNLLHLEFNNDKVESQQLQPIAGRPGGLFCATYESGGFRNFRIQAIVEWRPKYYLILMYDGPDRLRSTNEPLFHKVLSSLQQLPDRFSEKEIRAAVHDGAIWIRQISKRNEDLNKALIPEEFFRLDMAGKAIGFVRVTQAETTYKGFRDREIDGIEIRERGWTFGQGDWARRTQRDLFLGNNLEHEQWKIRITTLIPGAGDRPPSLDVISEDGLRTNDILLSNQCYQLNQPPVVNKPVRLPPAYISRVLQRLMPRLFEDLSKPRMLAFASFDHGRTDVVFRIVELKGRSDMPNGVTIGKVYRIDEGEGLASEPASLYVDESGVVQMLKSGDFTMTRVERPEIETKFGARIAKAQRALHGLENAVQADDARFDRNRATGGN